MNILRDISQRVYDFYLVKVREPLIKRQWIKYGVLFDDRFMPAKIEEAEKRRTHRLFDKYSSKDLGRSGRESELER